MILLYINHRLRNIKSGPNLAETEQFVHTAVRQFTLTIGVGDTPEQDAKFHGECDIRILMRGDRANYLNATDLYSIVSLIKSLRDLVQAPDSPKSIPLSCQEGVERLLSKSKFDTNAFIMTPFRADTRYLTAIKTIKDELKKRGGRGWTADEEDLDPDRDLWVNVRCYMHGCKYGIALIAADEITEGDTTRVRKDVFNPNVIVEAGYMIGQGKEVLMFKDDRVDMPTDWHGKLVVPFNLKNPEKEIREGIQRWIRQ